MHTKSYISFPIDFRPQTLIKDLAPSTKNNHSLSLSIPDDMPLYYLTFLQVSSEEENKEK